MNFRTSLIFSCLIHVAAFGILQVGAHQFLKKSNAPVTIDLSFVKLSPQMQIHDKPKTTTVVKHLVKRPELKNEIQENSTSDQIAKDTILDTLLKKSEITSADVNIPSAEEKNSSIVFTTEHKEEVKKDQIQKKYLAEQFQYIAKLIEKKTVYPVLAEQMGISGTVCLDFVVNVDGTLGDIMIKQSSGFEILDKDAVKTVKRSAPFPSPPIRVRIQFPLQYSIVN